MFIKQNANNNVNVLMEYGLSHSKTIGQKNVAFNPWTSQNTTTQIVIKFFLIKMYLFLALIIE